VRRIVANDCPNLRIIPPLDLETLELRRCTALRELPEGLRAASLDLTGCFALSALPDSVGAATRNLILRGCAALEQLPSTLGKLTMLDLSGCSKLASLPDSLQVRSWIDVAESGLTELPWSLRSVRVLWSRVPVSDRVAFQPETITAKEVLEERNAAMRRLLLQRMGMQRFMQEARAVVVNEDLDAGGQRQLLRVAVDGDEDIYCVSVRCPSTGGRYFLRVPPTMRTCAQAVAWTAGYRSPTAYRPVVET